MRVTEDNIKAMRAEIGGMIADRIKVGQEVEIGGWMDGQDYRTLVRWPEEHLWALSVAGTIINDGEIHPETGQWTCEIDHEVVPCDHEGEISAQDKRRLFPPPEGVGPKRLMDQVMGGGEDEES